MSAFKTATVKQVEFIEKLMGERVHGATYVQTQLDSLKVATIAEVSSHTASNIIGVLLNEAKTEKAMAQQAKPKPVSVEEGLYRNDDGVTIKVQRSKTSGKCYGKKLVVGKEKGTFVYEPGLIYTLRPEHKMTLEDGLAFSGKIGFCCMCGRTLMKKESVEAGIGPICATKF